MGYSLKKGAAFNPILKFPRNEPCFCRSGKKFKKCCLPKMPKVVTTVEAEKIDNTMGQIIRHARQNT